MVAYLKERWNSFLQEKMSNTYEHYFRHGYLENVLSLEVIRKSGGNGEIGERDRKVEIKLDR